MSKIIDDLILRARQDKRSFLQENESKEILSTANIPVIPCRKADSMNNAVELARSLGLPVVLKALSPQIIHKSDIGGVKLNISTIKGVREGYRDILNKGKKYDKNVRVSVQKMADPGIEIIVGVTRDPQFGPVIMFGLGGILVEIIKDVSFRLIPITAKDAEEMILEIKGYPLLTGYRGNPPINIENIKIILMQVSQLITDYPRIKELDLNPVFAYPDSVLTVDARIILEEND